MKLEIEMVPHSMWNKNLRSMLTKKQWDIVRKKSYELADGKCEICMTPVKLLHCHEVWKFDDELGIQFLDGLEAICNKCHMCHHIGFAITQHYKGNADFESVKRHFLMVNNISEAFFNDILLKEVDIWVERSKKEWEIDIGFLQEYCHKHDLEL